MTISAFWPQRDLLGGTRVKDHSRQSLNKGIRIHEVGKTIESGVRMLALAWAKEGQAAPMPVLAPPDSQNYASLALGPQFLAACPLSISIQAKHKQIKVVCMMLDLLLCTNLLFAPESISEHSWKPGVPFFLMIPDVMLQDIPLCKLCPC